MRTKRNQMMRMTLPEEELMQVLWPIKKAIIYDVIDSYPNPKPVYTSVASLLRSLEKKGIVGHSKSGSRYEFFPLISKKEYAALQVRYIVKNFFDGDLNILINSLAQAAKTEPNDIDKINKLFK